MSGTADNTGDGHVSIDEAFAAPAAPVAATPAPVPAPVAAKGSDLKLDFKGCGQTFSNDGELVEVVKDITFTVEGNQTIAILGPSGCGKSTLLRMVSGMHPRGIRMPTVGECCINGEAVLTPHDDVVTVFQSPVLVPWLSVLGNVMLSFKPFLFGPRPRWPWEVAQDFVAAIGDRFEATRLKIPCSDPYKEIEAKAITLLKEVGLGDSLHQFPHQLSGGMKQRCSLATSLVVEPKILCMDEPFSALDPTSSKAMQEIIVRLRDKYPCLILFVTHNVRRALDLADRIIVLSTRPATIAGDIRLPANRPEDWKHTPEYAGLEAKILHLISDASEASDSGGELTISV